MENCKAGCKKVPIAGIDDKRQITAVFTITLDVQGTTSTFPSDWHVTSIPNHWANENTTKDYIEKFLVLTFLRNNKN